MEAGASHGQPPQPSREAKTGRCQPRMSRTNSFVQFQAIEFRITGPSRRTIGGAQQCRFVMRNKPILPACAGLATLGKNTKPQGENDAVSYDSLDSADRACGRHFS